MKWRCRTRHGARLKRFFARATQLRIQLTAAAVPPPAEHAARRPAEAAGAAAADAGVIYAKYLIDKYAPLMHTHAHENNTEHTGGPSEKSRSTDGHSRKDIVGAFGA